MDYHMNNKGQPPQCPFEAIEEIFFEFYNDEAINHPARLMQTVDCVDLMGVVG
jgi:hypothetical protein